MRPYARYPTGFPVGFFFAFYFFWVGGPVGHKQRLYAKLAILARREARAVVGVGGPEGHKHNPHVCDNMLP